MLRPDDIGRLLDTLVADLGFRVSEHERRRLLQSSPLEPDEFAQALLSAAGIDPTTCDRRLLIQLSSRVRNAMRAGRQ